MEILELKIYHNYWDKNSLDGLKSRKEATEERVDELKDRSIEII